MLENNRIYNFEGIDANKTDASSECIIVITVTFLR